MPNLLFCMTPGVGLNTWKGIGSLKRELRPYLDYVRRGWKVKILTFDRDEIPELPEGVETVRFPHYYLLWFLPWVYKGLGDWADVIKTNQSVHAYFYTRAAKQWGKPILLRCGYVQGEYLETTYGLTNRVKFYQRLEAKAFKEATHCQVPTVELSEWVQGKYGITGGKISIVPNFVDAEIFKPANEIKKREKSIISVGRLESDKRFDMLIRACAMIPGCALTLVGEGSERHNLEKLAKRLDLNLSLPGKFHNEELPGILRKHKVFAVTSIWEGHPKTLIEAMACGMPCIGVNVTGIQNIIKDSENGLLVEPDAVNIKDAIVTLFTNNDLCDRLGQCSRDFVVEKFSFSKCFEIEYQAMRRIIEKAQ